MAEQHGIEAVALCDHNTVAGLPSFLEAAAGSSVEAIPGIEFSTDYCGKELHILGLFIQPEHYDKIMSLLEEMLWKKEQSNIRLVEALGTVGIALDYEAIKKGTPNGQVNRAVIAAELVRKGYCASVKEAFSRWLSPKCGFYCPPDRLEVMDTIRYIKSIGAVAVLAHPFLNLEEESLRIFLSQARESGLDAMETFYPKYDDLTTEKACQIAAEYGLLCSGGSDFHGENKPDIALGTGRDNLNIPYAVLAALRLRQKQKLS